MSQGSHTTTVERSVRKSLEVATQFVRDYMRPHAPEEEGSLRIEEVMVEEFAYLDGAPAPPLRHREWTVHPQHILDLSDLARRISAAVWTVDTAEHLRRGAAFDASMEVSRALLGSSTTDGAGLRKALHEYATLDQPPQHIATLLTEQLAGRMNELLQHKDLCRRPGFATLVLDAHAADLRARHCAHPAGRHLELNRLLFEAAYPSQLAKARDLELAALYDHARQKEYAALCISGGGIRSATFGLGVLQGLARTGLLHRFHYLSTVSGGGYLGSWLSAWMMRSGPTHVSKALSDTPTEKLEPDPEPIRHLRAFSNFLSPRLGVLSADTWTIGATYLRNLWINWLVSLPLLAAVIMIPYIVRAVIDSEQSQWHAFAGWTLPALLVAAGGILAVQSVRFVHASRPQPAKGRNTESGYAEGAACMRVTQEQFLVKCLLPLVLATALLTTAWQLLLKWNLLKDNAHDAGGWLHYVPFVDEHLALTGFMVFGALVHVVGWLITNRRAHQWVRELFAILGTGALAGATAHFAADLLAVPARPGSHDNMYVVFAMPLFLTMMLLGSQLFLGLTSAKSQDPEREWGARFNAWVLIVIASWVAFSSLVLFGPPLLLTGHGASTVAKYLLTVIGGWSGLTTIALGWSAKTGDKSGSVSTASAERRAALLAIAAPTFAATIIVLISALDEELIRRSCKLFPPACLMPTRPEVWLVLGIAVLLAALGIVFGRGIDTNKFSLHAMYRARLIRAYLGASRPGGDRNPDPFTGFDEFDNMQMNDLWPAAPPADHKIAAKDSPTPPLHVLNVALNLVGGRNLAWQERKAESFTITALHAGSPFTGYRRTSARRMPPGPAARASLAQKPPRLYGGESGITLGTALTISGAAANPNMGYHSSPAVTFLLTLFNARLGWWLGNPGPAGQKSFDRSAPLLTAGLIVRELFGLTNDRAHYVQLSDGGHFDNLGLYEMVLRRCRNIVVVDASGDPNCSFDDLGSAIRKIRIDLGVPIEFDGPLHIHPRDAKLTPTDRRRYWAVGRIAYSCVDASPELRPEETLEMDGTLIYVKPTIYSDEPRDILTYAKEHPTFPHETTIDQFYSESQFESYRALGSHVIDLLARTVAPGEKKPASLEWLAQQVRQYHT